MAYGKASLVAQDFKNSGEPDHVRAITEFRKILKCALYYVMKFSELNLHKD